MTTLRITLLLQALLCCTSTASCQVGDEHLAGSDRGEHQPENQQHFFGDWTGARPRLLQRGVRLDLLYAGDQLWNLRSTQKQRLATWTRIRGTVDWDLHQTDKIPDLSLHITAVWQGGGNLGKYLGTIAAPSGIASENTFRLDSWWLEKRLLQNHLAVRAGQFAAQDTYGEQLFGGSYVFEPFQYGLGNRGADNENFDPASTPAAEVRIAPLPHTYAKAIVYAADPNPYTHNTTGLIPQFRGAAASGYELGYVAGKGAPVLKPQDTVESRRGYSGLYRVGATYNPRRFVSTSRATPVSGNHLLYASANQAVYRKDRDTDKGIDLAVSVDWTPPDRTTANQELDVGIRFNEPFPVRRHNSVDLAWVRSGISPLFSTVPPGRTLLAAEHAFEANILIDLPRGLLLQPVAQYYLHSAGRCQNVFVLGFHTKIDF